ncbi:TPM domain-containing protein [Cupriavidus pauculus]|uniref:TPM domain-containing protein n=1 Tax=Cupriavidus pauculus TaxID=82633 RepID=UPI001243C4A6|nr:TPM domain-containing protein [Cupriavidus pauculus]KAB0604773.1 TPM domain-containing protein [Cupriavidus pauculus]MCM3604754.1 TPM domain-containing protein [Cupriavidus pauculus]UAK98792.1 TPM domain-containing protein [Cupriavidus pauculus]
MQQTSAPRLPLHLSLKRTLRHLGHGTRTARKAFPRDARHQLQVAVHKGEQHHRGEVRVVIEASLPLSLAWRGASPRDRARALFGALEVWNTEDHSGVLLYINLADHAVELLADRGIDARVDPRLWHGICNTLAQGLAQDLSVKPVLAAIAQIHALLTEHFPADAGRNPNELDDRPIIL